MRSSDSHEVNVFIQAFIDGTYKRKKQYSQHYIKDEFPNASFLMFGGSEGTTITCARITGDDKFPPLYLWSSNHGSDIRFPINSKPIDFNYVPWNKNGLDITEAEIIDHDNDSWLLEVDRNKLLVGSHPEGKKVVSYSEYIGWESIDNSGPYKHVLLGGSTATTVREARIETVPEESRNSDSMLIGGVWTAKTDETPPIITPETIETAKMKPWADAWELPANVTNYDDGPTQNIMTASINALETEHGREPALRIKRFVDTWNNWSKAVIVIRSAKGVHLMKTLPVSAGTGLECFRDTCGELCVKGELKTSQYSHLQAKIVLPVWTKLLKSKGVSF